MPGGAVPGEALPVDPVPVMRRTSAQSLKKSSSRFFSPLVAEIANKYIIVVSLSYLYRQILN